MHVVSVFKPGSCKDPRTLWALLAAASTRCICGSLGISFQTRTNSKHERNYGLGMHALVSVCFWNTNGIMAWACMLSSAYALGTRTELWFGHGCSGHRMLLEHERNYGLGMDALVTVCSWNTNGIMVWAWMLWSPYALGTRTELWLGHGCCGQRMLLEHERNYGLGRDALVTVYCSEATPRLPQHVRLIPLPKTQEKQESPGQVAQTAHGQNPADGAPTRETTAQALALGHAAAFMRLDHMQK